MDTPVVDTPAAQDFMSEIHARLDPHEIAAMTADLAAKSHEVRTMLPRGRSHVDPEELRWLLRSCFPSRRRAAAILEAVGAERLSGAVIGLVHGDAGLEERVAGFEAALGGFPEVTVDLPWELLHLARPEEYWLWTRWMWNPRTETGALRLVTVDDIDLFAASPVETYQRVGLALAMVHGTARAVDFVGDDPFGIDVFLACVYGIYMYTVLRMRMTQEFNRIVPELPSLARRLLGIHYREVRPCQ